MLTRRPSTQPLWNILKNGPLKVFVVGGGNWGTVISRIAAFNAKSSYIFDSTVHMWLRDEEFNGESLLDVTNSSRENKKYLPGYKLPENLAVVGELDPLIREADLIVIVIPHQFVEFVCDQIKGCVKPSARAVSLVKGLKIGADGNPKLMSSLISSTLKIPCSVLSGANVAKDIAKQNFSESTLGYAHGDTDSVAVWQQLFDTSYFKIGAVPDICGVEISGALKNIIALGAGFCEGLGYGTNTKAAIMRIGVEEMKLFANLFFDGVLQETFFDSAGYADVITTCFGGRNVKCAAEFVRRKNDSWENIERDLLGGQKLQGNLTCHDVYTVIQKHELEDLFPLFTTIYEIAFEGMSPEHIVQMFSTTHTRAPKMLADCHACFVPSSLTTKRGKIMTDQTAKTSAALSTTGSTNGC